MTRTFSPDPIPHMQSTPRRLLVLLALTAAASLTSARGGTFTWNNASGNWSVGASWLGGGAPSGMNAADVLVFGGDVGTLAGTPPNYTATNDITAVPFFLNQITLQATDANGAVTDPAHVITGNALRFSGAAPQVVQTGAGPITFDTPLALGASLTLAGDGIGSVTFNRALTGFADLVKNGASTFRFGTLAIAPALTAPSDNTWIGAMRLNGGTLRFNNNADSGRTALRANPLILPATATGTPTLSCSSELRFGAASGTVGKIESQVVGTNTPTEDIVVTALADGVFTGTLRLGPPTGTGGDGGQLVVRGPGVQTFNGTVQLEQDIEIGGSLVFAGTAELGTYQTAANTRDKGKLIMGGGTFRLDNSGTNNNNRLRDASSISTGLDLDGGGTFILDGNAAGTSETIGRIQFSALTGTTTIKTKQRSGQLGFLVRHRAGATAATVLSLQTYERDATTLQPLDTVEFSATDAAGTVLNLGVAGSNPRIEFLTLPIAVSNGLLTNNTGTASTGWATVKTTGGLAFATHGANGIASVATTATWASNTAANVLLSASQSIGAVTFSLNSLRMAPGAAQSLSIASGGTLATTGLILSGVNDFAINGPGALGGGAPRYVHVEQATLTLGAALGTLQPLVKSGDGTLLLTNTGNNANLQIFAINRGLVRATSGTTLPGGELRFRGGVLELTGGGTFNRPLVDGTGISAAGTVNWSTTDLAGVTTPAPTNVADDRGSGGFAAVGANAVVDLGAIGATSLVWEEHGFVQSGYALIFGSKTATAKVTLLDNISITSTGVTVNYNAREIRVDDNTSSILDRAVISGVISGTVHNDLLKTGAGVLELSGANTFAGLTIIQNGTLVVSGSIGGIGAEVMSGATLAGAGPAGNILLENGGRLSPGDATTATLTGSSLTWKAGGICRFDLGAANAADKLALGAGALTKSGSGTFAFDFGGTGQTGQTYTIGTFGSTNFSASDFTATNVTAGVTGTFQFSGSTLIYSTVTLTPQQQWRLTYFGTTQNLGTAADTADPDSDGLPNLDEYALGTSPLQPAATSGPVVGRSANHLTLAFTRNANATDITHHVEARNDLVASVWADIATRTQAAGWTTATGVTLSEVSGTVTVTDSADISTGGRRFLRLRVTQP